MTRFRKASEEGLEFSASCAGNGVVVPSPLAMRHALFASVAALSVLALAAPASGHAVLVSPPPLTQDDNAKAGPCGCYFGGGPEDPGENGAPCPGDFTVTTLQAGTQLTVKWLETVNHNGDFRIALSPKPPAETKKADVDANIVMEMADENGTSGAEISAKIIVPDTPCELCTIQLRQFMIGASQPYYYSCAAVKIVAADDTSSSGAGGAGGEGGNGNSGAGNGSGGAGSGAGGPVGQGGEAGSMGAGMADPQPKIEDGCNVAAGAGSWSAPGGMRGAGLAIVGLSMLAAFSRRRRRG